MMKRIGAAARARGVTVGGEPVFVTGVRELEILDRDNHIVQARSSLARADTLVGSTTASRTARDARRAAPALQIARSIRAQDEPWSPEPDRVARS